MCASPFFLPSDCAPLTLACFLVRGCLSLKKVTCFCALTPSPLWSHRKNSRRAASETETLQPQHTQKLNNDILCATAAVMREDGQSLPLMELASQILKRTARDFSVGILMC